MIVIEVTLHLLTIHTIVNVWSAIGVYSFSLLPLSRESFAFRYNTYLFPLGTYRMKSCEIK